MERRLIRVACLYDMNACYAPTGVTRHALAQIERLAARQDVDLTLVSGKIARPEGREYWEALNGVPRRELSVPTRHLLRWWRLAPLPPMEWLSGPVDWIYCPAEFHVARRQARVAVTSHDVLQGFRFGSERLRKNMSEALRRADLVLSVSEFNTARLLEALPECAGRIAYVPNAADDLFFEPAPDIDRAGVRYDLGLPAGVPFLLSVANFQPRKNLARLIRAAATLPEVASGDLALVMLGSGVPEEERALRDEIARLGDWACVRLPGYRQGEALRAIYAESTALVFPSLCESFGIPVVEAMAQGVPIALADSTALPEIGGAAGWYFNPEDEESIASTLRNLLDHAEDRARLSTIGLQIASRYRWDAANERLVAALSKHF
ncbi:glycosyltransferase family 4 protein [Paludisphaera rhizosphaerae]|uniref:glycosyltransferase family 4 protein n=1 Tax=Paludisphaera rhizosphaerae TaxID=2711216 RepID=UPI0013EDB227|nr:glycosyltransferase family 1 protein [Paludisphaera rhizosphaerae]